MPCAAACETGALTVPENVNGRGIWADVRMGVLELDPQRCITFQGAECGVCARACPIGEAALALDERGQPVLKPEGCVGCGVCVTACVTLPSSLKLRLGWPDCRNPAGSRGGPSSAWAKTEASFAKFTLSEP